MTTPPDAAAWLLLAALPACAWAAWSDLSRMTIPNRAVACLVLGFALVGPLVLPPGDWAWRWTHLVVVLLAGMALNAARVMGAGDAKFLAAAAPYVALADWREALTVYVACFLAAFALHRLAAVAGGRRLAPGWASWNAGRRFPMGLPLALTLVAYLALAARA